MNELTTFDKINLATCASRRAQAHFMNDDRFSGEFDTVSLWKRHKVVRSTLAGVPWGYVTTA